MLLLTVDPGPVVHVWQDDEIVVTLPLELETAQNLVNDLLRVLPSKRTTTALASAGEARNEQNTDSNRGLNDRQRQFIHAYVVDFNATKAAKRVGYSSRTAHQIGYELLRKPEIAAAIDEECQSLAERTRITQERVLRRLWDQATADVNRVVQHRHGACRYCWGTNHEFQWTTEREWREAYDQTATEILDSISLDSGIGQRMLAGVEARTLTHPALPKSDGGFGYRRQDAPNPDCPECGGDGVSHVHVVETRYLDDAALAIYEGIKKTRRGVEVKIVDRQKALELVARHLGML